MKSFRCAILFWLVVAMIYGGMSCSRDTNPAAPAESQGRTHEAIEQQIHEQVNAYRAEQGLGRLSLRSVITQQARQHSENMATGRVEFSHNGFEDRISTIAKSLKLQSAAENVAYNSGYDNPGKQAVQGWLNSDGHRKNIEGDYNLTGIGVVEIDGAFYFTQIFVLSN